MVKVCRTPRYCRVTVVAIVAAADMSRVLTGSNRAIVARRACTNDLRVIDRIRWFEERRIVTVFAHIARQYVILILANCRRAIVARRAGSIDLRMIHLVCWREQHGVVAVFT